MEELDMALSTDFQSLIGKKVDPRRRATWHWPSATFVVPSESIVEFAEVNPQPAMGDLVLSQVTEVRALDFIEDRNGCNLQIFPGSIILSVVSTRYAPAEYEALVPKSLKAGQELSLLNRGGAVGEVQTQNSKFREPTQVKILASFKDSSGSLANTKRFAPKGDDSPGSFSQKNVKMILIVGSSMDSGKSNAAKAVVYALSAHGHHVVAGKVTGTAARRDALLMKAAGAESVADFTNFGYPATYLLESSEMKSLFWKIRNELVGQLEGDGYLVLEIADGILQRENEILLSDETIRKHIAHTVFACGDSLSAMAGVQVLRDRYQLTPSAIAGRVANSEIGIREAKQGVGDIPFFDNMTIDVPYVAELVK